MNVRPVFLIVHRRSYKYINSVAEYILNSLKLITGSDVMFKLADRIEEINYPSRSIIFIIGDPFPKPVKAEGCFYIFINFSLLYNINKNFRPDWRARRWINKKHRRFMSKARTFDMILDFYSPQTDLLEQELEGLPVKIMPFLTNVTRKPGIVPPLNERKWDICVVGSLSPRRTKVYKTLRKLGYRLSNFETPDLQSVIADSKLALNIHVQNCNTFEAPRVIQTLSMGCCLVSEPCYGIEEIIPIDCYCSTVYEDVVSHISELLENPDRIKIIGEKAERYIKGQYADRCFRNWKSIAEAIPS